MAPFPLLLLEAQGDFSLILLWEANLTLLCRPPYDWVPLEFLTLWIVSTESPAAHQLQFRFPATSSWGISPRGSLLSGKLWPPLFGSLSLQCGSSRFPCVLLSHTSRRSCCFLSLFSFSLVVRTGVASLWGTGNLKFLSNPFKLQTLFFIFFHFIDMYW